ncbi:MAG: DegT/DnrJ/EryC1/StrS family aminotransferase, partial [Anaerolineales bacterium]|nr:DegT/DnrJ/EryC1/StrS family aminotransferase [Anaerolineales bacterium]
GREQLKKLPRNNRLRREKTALYRQLLAELSPEIVVPFEEHPGVSACHLLPILLPDGTPRESFMENMKAQGIQTSIHYPPIHRFSAYRDLNPPGAANLPQTESAATREVTLPLYPALSEDDIRFVAKAVQTSLAGVARALA